VVVSKQDDASICGSVGGNWQLLKGIYNVLGTILSMLFGYGFCLV
jgi:hypothetical protein